MSSHDYNNDKEMQHYQKETHYYKSMQSHVTNEYSDAVGKVFLNDAPSPPIPQGR